MSSYSSAIDFSGCGNFPSPGFPALIWEAGRGPVGGTTKLLTEFGRRFTLKWEGL